MISQRLCAKLRVDEDGKSVTDRSVGWTADVHTQSRREYVCVRLNEVPLLSFVTQCGRPEQQLWYGTPVLALA